MLYYDQGKEVAAITIKYPNQKRFDAAHTSHYSIKLNHKTDADIIAKLEQLPNKQGYIKQAIRDKMQADEQAQTDQK